MTKRVFKFRRNLFRAGNSSALRRNILLADGFRDTGAFSQAARHYEEALSLAPGRSDIKVQLANMLKDSGDLPKAQATYESALLDEPGNADIYLQLGHVKKLGGNRAAALECYRRALGLDPLLAGAHLELAAAGEPAAQLIRFEHQMRQGGVDALLTIRGQLDDIVAQVAKIRESLPDAQTSVAFPLETYTEMRRLFDCPEPVFANPALSIEVILLADRESLEGLHTQISAIVDQAHAKWTLRLVGSESSNREIAERASACDHRVRWVEIPPDANPVACEYQAAADTAADWVLFLSSGARLHPQALSWIAAAAARTEAVAMVMDEEVSGNGGFSDHLRFAPRHIVDPQTILEANVYGETIAVSANLLAGLDHLGAAATVAGARALLLLAVIGAHRVAHIPLPLVRAPERTSPAPDAITQIHAAAVRKHLGEKGSAEVAASSWSRETLRVLVPPLRQDSGIAVIIPTKDNIGDTVAFVESLLALAKRPEQLEILILNNGRALPSNPLLASLAERRGISVMDIAEPFNWSRFNNLGARETVAPYIVFANDDMIMLSQDWDDVVRSFMERPKVGAVGARLLYPDDTLQHGGILFNWRGSVIHDGLYRPAAEAGPAHRWHVTRTVSAVTGAFLATRRSDFERVGGFEEAHLAVSYNDVDYALKLRARGLHIVWTPMLTLYHHESKTRGLDHLSEAKTARNAVERRVLEARWPGVMTIEPSLNPFWRQATLPHRLLAFPSQSRIWAYIENSAAENPWAVVGREAL